jgi:hypothetical protein
VLVSHYTYFHKPMLLSVPLSVTQPARSQQETGSVASEAGRPTKPSEQAGDSRESSEGKYEPTSLRLNRDSVCRVHCTSAIQRCGSATKYSTFDLLVSYYYMKRSGIHGPLRMCLSLVRKSKNFVMPNFASSSGDIS